VLPDFYGVTMASQEQLSKLQSVVAAAQASARKWGVPASVTLAQWIFESSWGASQLALKANNYFGVKWAHNDGSEDYVEMPTAEYIDGKRVMILAAFEKYSTIEASFEDHASLLASSARYRPAMAVAANPTAFCVQLRQCGYSTNPEYANALLSAIRAYDLAKYDAGPVANDPPTHEEFDAAVNATGKV
jgi:flagellum-specific peptidoglycan hydrolase FlgJ